MEHFSQRLYKKRKGEKMAEKNQDSKQREKSGNETVQHDESVLNPEIKNESDLSKKERRLIEKEKLKGMGMGKKLEYIWMYYKPAIFGVIAAIVLVFAAKDYYEQAQIKTVFSMTVVNSYGNDTDVLEDEIKETLGYGEDAYSKVDIGVNLTTNADGDEFDYSAQMAYVAQLQAGTVDVMVIPETLYANLNQNEPFANLEELLGEETFAAFGTQTDKTHITLNNSELAEKLGVSYEPICIVVPVTAPDQENTAKWIESLVSE